MTTTETRRHNPIAPALPELTPQAEVALLARMLFREGYDDHLAGHITYKQPDDTLLVNPFGLTWDEVKASDVMRIDLDGNVLDGPWTVTPAISLHLELHRARHDVTVAVHNHPRWATIYADLGRAPAVYDQTSALVAGDVAVYADYEGPVNQTENARAAVEAMGDASMALLQNHGVLVVGRDIPQAYLRAATIEWRARQAWHVEAVGGGKALPAEVHEGFGRIFDQVNFPGLFEAMARRELREDPGILDLNPPLSAGFTAARPNG
ncbi:MAG: class II aldolase/adducin family protein [Actinomycetes bacterium]